MTQDASARALRRRGYLLAILANLCFSSGGFWIRSLEAPPDGHEIVFWRSVGMVSVLALALAIRDRGNVFAKIRAVGPWGVVSAAFLASTFFAFILSITRTTVANTTLVMSLAPLFGAVAGLIFLREPVAARTWIAIGVAAAGLTAMLIDSLSGDGLVGILFALGVPVGLAANVVINRRHGQGVDMVPTVLIAGLLSLPIALPFAAPFDAGPRDIGIVLVMGAVQLAGGCVLITLAMRHLPAAEIGLFTLLETVLGPAWVWLAYGETPTAMALAGGASIVGALLLNSLLDRKGDGRAGGG
jgi:drug/metabolite transporter (DMT)-like permease